MRRIERERVATEINKVAENVCHLIQNAMYVKFDVEGSTLGIIRHNESCIKIDTTENWYTLYLGNDNNWTIGEDTYNTQSINDIYEMIEKCLQIGILIFKREKESEPVTTLLDEKVIVTTPNFMEKELSVSKPVPIEEKLAVSKTEEIDLELQVVKEEQIKEVTKVQQSTRKITHTKKRDRGGR